MQIVDRFNNDLVKFSFPLQRDGSLQWDMSDNNYVSMYLDSLTMFANSKKTARGIYTVYDLCMDLSLNAKPVYAYFGWRKDEIIELNKYIDDNRIIIGFECRLL